MPSGFVSLASVLTDDGRVMPAREAVSRGFIEVSGVDTHDWNLTPDEVALGPNLFTNQGRKYLAYAFGGRSPVSNYVCSKFGVGNGNRPTTVADTSLDSPIQLTAGVTLKAIDGISYPEDYIAVIQFTIGSAEANGNLIREAGLFSGDGTLLARNVGYNINKTSGFAPVINWRIRF